VATNYNQELLDRATAYVGQPMDYRRREGLAEISALYSAITGGVVGTCRQCQYSDYLAVVTTYIRLATNFLHPELMSETKYAIVAPLAGETFTHDSYSKAVTAENLTDTDAEFFIKHGYKDAFVLKSGQTVAEAKDADKQEADHKAAERETKLKADLSAEKTAHKTTKASLATAEKRVTTLTTERDELQRQVDEAKNRLAEGGNKSTGEVADAVDPGATA
jgi:hypothetical protein